MIPAPVLVVTGPTGAGKTTVSRLVAAAFDPSVHVQIDAFRTFVVNGWINPWRPAASRQHEVLGGAVAAAVLQFAGGGYTVVLDGHIFPDVLEELGETCIRRGVPLHYAVLRPDLTTCLARVGVRRPSDQADYYQPMVELHGRFADLGEREANVIDAAGEPADVATALLSAFTAGRLVEAELIGGIERRTIELVEHDPVWAARFDVERGRISKVDRDRRHHEPRPGRCEVMGRTVASTACGRARREVPT